MKKLLIINFFVFATCRKTRTMFNW